MADVIYFQRHALARILQNSAAMIAVDMRRAGVEVPNGTYAAIQGFNVGPQLLPPMNLIFHDQGLEVTAKINGVSGQCFFPWQSIIMSVPLLPPDGGGGGGEQLPKAAAA